LTGAGLSSVGIISNPVGWGIGAGVTTYGWCRLWFDLGTKYGPSKWFIHDISLPTESRLQEYMKKNGYLEN